MMNAHDFSDFWQHCPAPAAAAAGFFYNTTGSTDSAYSNVVTQPRNLFAAAAAAASFDPNPTPLGTNSVSDSSSNNFITQNSMANGNSGAFTSNPFPNSFPSSFFGTNFGLPSTGSGFSFPTSTTRRQLPAMSQTASTTTPANALTMGTPTGFLFSSSNLNPLRQSLPQTQTALQQNPLTTQQNGNSNKSTPLLKIDNFLPGASLANSVNNSAVANHQLFDFNAFPSTRNISTHHTSSTHPNGHHNTNLISHLNHNHNSSRSLNNFNKNPITTQQHLDIAQLHSKQLSAITNSKLSNRNDAPQTASIPMEKNMSKEESAEINNSSIETNSNSTPSTSNNSTIPTQTSNNSAQQPQVTCQVCYLAASNGLHFGARTCAACAAFFRRSISDQKRYICKRSQRCAIRPGEAQGYRKMCRNCRMKRCLECGMLPENVQNKRHRREFYFMDTLASVPEQQTQVAPCQQKNLQTTGIANLAKNSVMLRKDVIKTSSFGNMPIDSLKKTPKCESPQSISNSPNSLPKLIKLENSSGSQFLDNASTEHDVKNFFNSSGAASCADVAQPESTTTTNALRHLENENSSPWLFAPLQLQHQLQQQNLLQQQQQQLPIATSTSLEFLGKIE